MKNIIKNICNMFKYKECPVCHCPIGLKTLWKHSGTTRGLYCNSCAKCVFKICDCCDKVADKLSSVEGKKICNDCITKKTDECDDCGERKFTSNLISHYSEHLCRGCYDDANRQFRYIDLGERKQTSKTFTNNPNNGYIGTEIECLNSDRDKNAFVIKELKKFRFSQGKDGSLSRGGVEFRSMPMNGDLLFESIESFGEALNKKQYNVDKSCGLHIHLEVDQDLEFLKKTYLFYLRFEDMFFNMLPKSRRSRSYCAKFKRYYKDSPKEIMETTTLDGFKSMLYETSNYKRKIRYHGHSKRYCWANLHSIFYRGTLEIRSHSGTVNPAKIINWIMIHQRVLEFLKEKTSQEIGTMKVTKKAFLEIFDKPIQNYIKRRWKTFIKLEEKDFIARSPIYMNTKSLKTLGKEVPVQNV